MQPLARLSRSGQGVARTPPTEPTDTTNRTNGHHQQNQWTYVACGLVRVAIHDCRPQSATYRKTQEWLIGDHQPVRVYRLPPGVVHGYRCLAGPAHVFYVTSGTYDPNDEIRLPHDGGGIGYDWLSTPAIR